MERTRIAYLQAGYKLDGPPLPPPHESRDGLRFLLTGTGENGKRLSPPSGSDGGRSLSIPPFPARPQSKRSCRGGSLHCPLCLSLGPKDAAVIPPPTRGEGLASREPFSPVENAWGNVPRLLHAGSLLLLGRKGTCSVDAGPIALRLE